MSRPTGSEIREKLLQVILARSPRKGSSDGPLQSRGILDEVARQIGAVHDIELEQALLTQWSELFRTGYLAWGYDIANPNPPFCHITDQGRTALAQLSRDPGNPNGYLKHLSAIAKLNPIAKSYLEEGLTCYASALHKSAAVMVGAAAESLALELKDAVISRLTTVGRPIPNALNDWRIKVILDGLRSLFDAERSNLPRPLAEEYGAYWAAFAQQIRATRNDAGHPTSVDPVTHEAVHAGLLIFPELAKLTNALHEWVDNHLK